MNALKLLAMAGIVSACFLGTQGCQKADEGTEEVPPIETPLTMDTPATEPALETPVTAPAETPLPIETPMATPAETPATM